MNISELSDDKTLTQLHVSKNVNNGNRLQSELDFPNHQADIQKGGSVSHIQLANSMLEEIHRDYSDDIVEVEQEKIRNANPSDEWEHESEKLIE